MRKTFLFQLFLIIATLQIVNAQQFDANQQYNQAMANAKHAFEAKQFSQAVMFYREAIKIKPAALLPKYKIEDIRTIYIKNEIDAIKPEPVVAEKPKPTGKSKKEIELENIATAEVTKAEASRKMNEDADKAEAELRELPVEVIEIREIDKPIEVVEVSKDREVLINNMEPKSQPNLEGESIKNETAKLVLPKREIPTENVKMEVEIAPTPKEIQKQKPIVKVQPVTEKPKALSTAEKQKWVEQETKRLAQTYPNKKTVEEIDKPGKHITRVIMNIDNKVAVYLKVQHGWGATFFFIDEFGLELKSINETYFNLMTNLKTYGD